MKSGTRIVALGVFLVTQVLISLPGHAQSVDVNNTLGLSVENGVTNLTPGESIMVDGWVTPGSDAKGTLHITTINASLIFDPTIFSVTSATVNPPNGSAFTEQFVTSGTFTVPGVSGPANGSWGGVAYTGTRLRNAAVVSPQTVFGTFVLTVNPNATTTDTQLFYSPVQFTNSQLVQASTSGNLAKDFQTGVLTSSTDQIGLTLASPTIITVHITSVAAVPGPSALLVFIMGAVPAMGMVRNRRRMRRFSRL